MNLNGFETLRNQQELASNSSLRRFFEQYLNDDALATQMLDQLVIFAQTCGLTFMNLLPHEWGRLIMVLHQSHVNNRFTLDDPTTKVEIIKWAKSLKHAVAKQGSLIAMYQQVQPSFRQMLEKYGYVPEGMEGQDIDAKHAIGQYFTDPRDITTAGSYIIAPVSNDSELIRERIADVMVNEPAGVVSLSILQNNGNHHWVVREIEINNGVVEKDETWDPIAAGVQQDGFRCLDYSLQRCLQNRGIHEHPIAQAQSGTQLRAAVISNIAANTDAKAPETLAGETPRFCDLQTPQKQSVYAVGNSVMSICESLNRAQAEGRIDTTQAVLLLNDLYEQASKVTTDLPQYYGSDSLRLFENFAKQQKSFINQVSKPSVGQSCGQQQTSLEKTEETSTLTAPIASC